ncbi:heme NO-binding domain-containing protein [Sphingomicrobium astaxanthinifaciens]|uniref:heme NO-binding domain-containing protein n=1 Tax=Sphingomicrobium astaxanthinifaciens TaxID=1227949 RepID=UPI001FCBEA7E|nr:heme NO-binding domain-containing protein [Sphingomicrobium astaxanthinifaciens]MCJ7420506.1 heme NO-binding domain-containing protein [Sphingomicrobium astaxanthinifaciens]
MKGVIFVELINYLEESGGALFAEEVIEAAKLPNAAAYSAVGTYPSAQALRMVEIASERTGTPSEELCTAFGRWLFERFTVRYPDIVGRYDDAETMLEHVGSHIHREVVVLYPDAVPPQVTGRREGDALVVDYRSSRPLAHIAYGLIAGCLAHFNDPRTVRWNDRSDPRQASFRIAMEK